MEALCRFLKLQLDLFNKRLGSKLHYTKSEVLEMLKITIHENF